MNSLNPKRAGEVDIRGEQAAGGGGNPRARLTRPAGWLRFESGWLNSEQALHNLETTVSLIQTASESMDGIGNHINDAIAILNAGWNSTGRSGRLQREFGRALRQKFEQIDDIARNCRFHGRGLLDGQSGVVGYGEGVDFVRGGPNTASSPPEGYEVKIIGLPSRASLTGGVALHEDWIRAEEEIFLAEGDRFIRYSPNQSANLSDFLADLQEAVSEAGLDLEVGMTRQRRLTLRHNQHGSHYKFKGFSRITPLLSKRPGKIEWSQRGRDIQGAIADEPAFGVGRMLIGFLDNAQTSELAVIWRGKEPEPGSHARCHIVQNGIHFQDGVGPERQQRNISLPSFLTHSLGRWMEGRSGFNSLADLHVKQRQEIFDAMQMLFAVSCEVDEWKERCNNWLKQYQNLALEILRNEVPIPQRPTAEGGRARQAQVEHMANTMRRMIGPQRQRTN